MNPTLEKFAVELFQINAIKFGEFKTKIGLMTPVYCDLRVIISYPHVMDTLAELLQSKLTNIPKIDALCGVPYTAIPIATALSLKTKLPMLMRRSETKDHGTKKKIEGAFKSGDHVVIVEDVITSGSSILETFRDLQNEGLKCNHAILLLNREQGGAKILEHHGIMAHYLLTLSQLVKYLVDAKCIDENTEKTVLEYIKNNQVSTAMVEKPLSHRRLTTSFLARAESAKNPAAAELLKIMSTKQTNLCLAADVTESTKLLNLAEELGPFICALKTHIDIVDDFNSNLIQPLRDIAKRHNFLLFEDRKFADIANTVRQQYSNGLYKISSWASLVTAHSVMGDGALEAIKGAPFETSTRGVFLLAQASSAGHLTNDTYKAATLKMAQQYPDLIAGIVCQSPSFLDSLGLIQLTPGVKIGADKDELDQQYNSPEHVIKNVGADVCVVGRGIVDDANPVEAAKLYRDVLWKAYLERIHVIKLKLFRDSILVFDIEDWRVLRRNLHIVGHIIGDHNALPALPLKLMPEEALLLLDLELAELYEPNNYEASKDFEESLFEAQKEAYRESRRQQLATVIDEIVVRKRKSGDQRCEEEIFNEELERSCLLNRESMIFPILVSEHNAQLTKLSRDRIVPLTDPIKYSVFKDLHKRGYYVTNGAKFGADFLVYSEDPLIVHATLVVLCVEYTQPFTSIEIVTFTRLAGSVNKRPYLASVKNGLVKYIGVNPIGELSGFSDSCSSAI